MTYITVDDESEAKFLDQVKQFEKRADKIIRVALAKILALQVEAQNSDAAEFVDATFHHDDPDGSMYYAVASDKWGNLEERLDNVRKALTEEVGDKGMGETLSMAQDLVASGPGVV